jgi:hypothetical protein
MIEALFAFILLELHGPGNQYFEVNPEAVVGLRTPRESEHFGAGVKCIVNTNDGKFFAVVEDCATVRRMIEGEE